MSKCIEKKNKKKKEEKSVKKKLKPGYEMIKRFQHDPQYDIDQITIVYLDRFTGLEETDLEDFVIGDVPYHRMQKIKINNYVVWDRELRLDLVADGTALQYLNQ